MTDAPRELCTITNYSDLHELMRERAAQIGISRGLLDDVSGVPEGYSGTLLAPRPVKRLGNMSMAAMLPALGIRLVALEDPEALARTLAHSKYKKRKEKAALHAAVVHYQVSKRFLRKIGRAGGKASRSKMTPGHARKLARRAARARWAGRVN